MPLPQKFNAEKYSSWYSKNLEDITYLLENPIEGIDAQYINQLAAALSLLSMVETIGEDVVNERASSDLNNAPAKLKFMLQYFSEVTILGSIRNVLIENGFGE